MTNKEAKEKLYIEWQKFLENNIDYAGISEAYKMAFKALNQEPCNDAISREDVINLKWQGEASEEFLEGYASAIEDARVLPSVTPQPCKDTISRQAVLETLDDMDNVLDEDRTIENYKELLKECYEVLPSVKPQEKTGHWIQENSVLRCSICDVGVARYDKYSYCPNCGAKMIEKQKRSNKCKNCEYYRNPDYTKCHECEAERNNK